MQNLILSLALAGPLAATTLAPAGAHDAADRILPVHYVCEGGLTMEVVFLNTAGGNSYAFVLADGEMTPMRVAVSASGARYLSLEKQPTRQFWEAKGRADLWALEGQAETPLRTGCAPTGEGEAAPR